MSSARRSGESPSPRYMIPPCAQLVAVASAGLLVFVKTVTSRPASAAASAAEQPAMPEPMIKRSVFIGSRWEEQGWSCYARVKNALAIFRVFQEARERSFYGRNGSGRRGEDQTRRIRVG